MLYTSPLTTELRKFLAPEFVFGIGARNLASQYAANYGIRKILLVTDSNLYANTPWVSQILQTFQIANIPCVIFDQISPNPRANEVMAGAALFSQEHCNGIVAVGGGSVIDCAKGIGIVHSNGGHILDFEGIDRISRAMPPLICIPTTSGTASEVSQFAIIRNEVNRSKFSVVSKAVVPDIGLLDPETSTSMDSYTTACSGMDALAHAIEAYVSNASSPITDLHAVEAIRIIWEALPQVIDKPYDIFWRTQMLLGSLQAGLAFSNAILGAVHALTHSLEGYYDLTHGECNAILLGPVMACNYSACPRKFQNIGRIFELSLDHFGENAAALTLCQSIESFRRKIGLTHSLQDLGVSADTFSRLADGALHDVCLATNIKPLNKQDLEALYEQAF